MENNNKIADSATLAFFSNPLYLTMIQKKNIVGEEDNNNDVKFYRKRIISLFKDILKGEESTRDLKEMHTKFVKTAIKYFEMVDKRDIIQAMNQHNNDVLDNSFGDDLLANTISVSEANEHMMRKTINVSNLDNYVITNQDFIANDVRIIPVKMDIDLKDPALKTKGVKVKINTKKKIKNILQTIKEESEDDAIPTEKTKEVILPEEELSNEIIV